MSVLHCDGTGWISIRASDHYRPGRHPCPSCNPYLYDLWITPGKWNRWLKGVPVGSLTKTGPMPDPCRRTTTGTPCTFEQGLRIMEAARQDELTRIAATRNPT